MTKPESKRSGAAVVTGRSAAEEQVNNGSSDPPVSAGSHEHSVAPATPTKPKSGKQTSREHLSRRTTESEVFDDGTNTFFW